jgi:hypothetical protein
MQHQNNQREPRPVSPVELTSLMLDRFASREWRAINDLDGLNELL